MNKKLTIPEIDETPPELDLTSQEVEALLKELETFHDEFADLYYRVEQAQWAHKYLQGLMLPIERKSIQPMAQALEGGNVQAMQQFIGQGKWQDEKLLEKHRYLVDETLGEEDGVYIVDGSGFPKKGEHSVGVARQWCGALGKVANCQVGVFGAYASRKGYTLVDHQLYLPEKWFDTSYEERWQTCRIPEETPFQTKPELALKMIEQAAGEGHLRFQWVTCDEAFGRNPVFLDGIDQLERWYLAEVPHNTRVWTERPETDIPAGSGVGRPPSKTRLKGGQPDASHVSKIASHLSEDAWQAYRIKEGSKGPMVAAFAFLRVVAVRNGLPGPDVWLVLRRSLGEDPELKTYLSNAPADVAPRDLVRIAGMRWPIETVFQEAKGELGMDHYEVRTWVGWHHHMTMCLLAHHFLVRTQHHLKKGHPL